MEEGAWRRRSVPDRRNMRARYLKHGDPERTRATFLHGCLKFDIKELLADSSFQCRPDPGRSHVCEVAANSWIRSHAANNGSEWQLLSAQ